MENGPEGKIIPVRIEDNLLLASTAYIIKAADTPIIWRGPAKMKMIQRFIQDIDWGELDWLIIDAPPGTGDEPLSVAQLLPDSKALIVTTAQDVSLLDTKKAINFAKELKLDIAGLIENMSGLTCPHCGQDIGLFKKGCSQEVAEDYGIPFLGSLPLSPDIANSAEQGQPIIAGKDDHPAKKVLLAITDRLLAQTAQKPENQ
jgi:Mrp family chromosome partitioning ATPase